MLVEAREERLRAILRGRSEARVRLLQRAVEVHDSRRTTDMIAGVFLSFGLDVDVGQVAREAREERVVAQRILFEIFEITADGRLVGGRVVVRDEEGDDAQHVRLLAFP